MDNRAVGIFDSGVGAFSVLRKLVDVLPNEDFIYFADSGHNPYGQKTKEQLEILCETIAEFLLEKDVKIIVVACNTATMAALPQLQEKFKGTDIIGVIEGGAKDAISATKNGKIGVCSTVFTAKTHAYKIDIDKYKDSKDITVYEEGSVDLAHKIETGFDKQNDAHMVKEFVDRFKGKDIDTLILGCTHYPLLQDVFEKCFDGNLVDPGMSTANKVKEILLDKNMLSDRTVKGSYKYFVTKSVDDFKKSAKNLVDIEVEDVTQVDIEDRLKEKGF